MNNVELKLGIIGQGARATDVLRNILMTEIPVRLTCVCDPDQINCRSRLESIKIDPDTVKFYNDADIMLDENDFDGIIIGTHCDLHTQYAVKVFQRNINLYLEKPLALTIEDLNILHDAYEKSSSKVVVSLPLRVTYLAKLAHEIIQSGRLGQIEHVEAYNNVAYGDVYYQSWYRNEKVTGGLFLQKAVHDFDYINNIIGLKPVMICAMKSKQVFKGPKKAGSTCDQCDENESCPQSPYIKKHIRYQYNYGNLCCFAEDTGNEDSGSAIIMYESGMHVNYTQNFFCRNTAGERGAKFFGYKGTLDFDWSRNILRIHHHDIPRLEEHKFSTTLEGHGGGDGALALNFIRMLQGIEESCAPLNDAIISNLMCIKAKESSETYKFLPIDCGRIV